MLYGEFCLYAIFLECVFHIWLVKAWQQNMSLKNETKMFCKWIGFTLKKETGKKHTIYTLKPWFSIRWFRRLPWRLNNRNISAERCWSKASSTSYTCGTATLVHFSIALLYLLSFASHVFKSLLFLSLQWKVIKWTVNTLALCYQQWSSCKL